MRAFAAATLIDVGWFQSALHVRGAMPRSHASRIWANRAFKPVTIRRKKE